MSTFSSIILLALLVGQTSAFMGADTKAIKSTTALDSFHNRNYDPVGGYGNERHMGGGMGGGMMHRHNDYNRGGYGGGYNGGYNDYNRGGYNDYDRGYGGGRGMTRSKYGDWLNGSSNYIPTSADRNHVMDRGHETAAGRYNNYYINGDRHNSRHMGGGGGYGMMNNRYNDHQRGPYQNDYNRGGMGQYGNNQFNRAGGVGQYGNNQFSRGAYNNEYDRYSPVGYNNNNRYGGNQGSYDNQGYNSNYSQQGGRGMRSGASNNEYERTYRSPMDSHRQTYPNYGMGAQEDTFGYKKWWDGK
ncbi:MAG: hypothetical protein SGBAC_009676 [Bacillariaceae sp.]